MIYVVGIELVSSESKMAAIESWLSENSRSHVRVLPQLWIIETTIAADQIRTGLDVLLNGPDRLIIVKAGHEAVTRELPDPVKDWVTRNFPDSLTERIPGTSSPA